jgi:hypothetical protein
MRFSRNARRGVECMFAFGLCVCFPNCDYSSEGQSCRQLSSIGPAIVWNVSTEVDHQCHASFSQE